MSPIIGVPVPVVPPPTPAPGSTIALALDAKNIFLNPGDPGIEAIVYMPYNGTAQAIYADVRRCPLNAEKRGGQQVVQGKDHVYISAADIATIKERFDRVTYKPRLGGPDVTVKVNMIVEQDMGMWYLELGE